MDAADDDNAGTALYAPYQTTVYTAPSVVNGRIPKNQYGNLDVYVPSMVPPGGVHLPHPDTARVARILGIDYADAITGFSFKGRHGTAITNGAVVAAGYREAVEAVIKAFEDERAQAEEERRSLDALKMWKRFLAGLRIRQRIEGYDIEGERDTAMKHEMEKAKDEDEDKDEDEGGGFLPDRDAGGIAQPTAKTRYLSGLADENSGGGFYMPEGDQEEMEAPQAFDRFVNRANDDDDNDDNGGFRLEWETQDVRREISRNNQGTSHEHSQPIVHTLAGDDGQEISSQGGGLFPDDDQIRENPPADNSTKSSNQADAILKNHGSIDPYSALQNEEQVEKAFPDLPAGGLEEARTLQQLYELQSPGHLPVSQEDVTAPASSRSPDSPPKREATAGRKRQTVTHPSETYSSNDRVAEDDSALDSSEEDKGSLLSHDPDDEDADPEWLA